MKKYDNYIMHYAYYIIKIKNFTRKQFINKNLKYQHTFV